MIKGINVITDRRESPDEESIRETNRWFSLAKNIAWALGIIFIICYKINAVDNTNAKQDDDIKRTQVEVKSLRDDITSIRGSQTDQLVMLTKLITIAERADKK